MKIVLVSQEYPPETAFGGIGTQTFQKAQGLSQLGHSVIVLSHSKNDRAYVEWQGKVKVVRIQGASEGLTTCTEPARWIAYSVQVARALQEIIPSERPDLVDFPEWGGEGFFYLLNRTHWDHVPAVVHLHGPTVMFAHCLHWPELGSDLFDLAVMMEGSSVRLCDRVYSSSRCSTWWAREHYGLAAMEVPTLHTGVDTSHFRPLNVQKDRFPSVVFVGKIALNKGVDVLVEAACRIASRFPGFKVKIAGRGNESLKDELVKKLSAQGQSGLADFLGYVPRGELPTLLSKSHLFVAPSLYEGGPGFVYLEAMACGLPVIACEGSGASEVVSHGENGILIEPGNPDQLVSAMDNLFSCPEELVRMGRKAREFVLRSADSRGCIKSIEAFYEKAVGGKA